MQDGNGLVFSQSIVDGTQLFQREQEFSTLHTMLRFCCRDSLQRCSKVFFQSHHKNNVAEFDVFNVLAGASTVKLVQE
jgi:hypothetical protein